MSAIPTSIRETVAALWGGQCARCGMAATALHHRKRRRDGGHDVVNLLPLCGTCHRWVHLHPAAARLTGYIVSFAAEPAEAPVKTKWGWRRVTPEGLVAV